MSRRPASVTQAAVKRTVKAVLDAGVEVARVEVGKDGKIVVIAGKPGEHIDVGANDLDAWMAQYAATAQGH
ncbi:MAG: hypothetical protein WAV38_26570 [Xanthobacteraceae bacterium]